MAIWRVASTREGLKISYKNQGTGGIWDAGLVRSDTPIDLLVKWVASQDAASPWDRLELPDGQVLLFLPACRGRQ